MLDADTSQRDWHAVLSGSLRSRAQGWFLVASARQYASKEEQKARLCSSAWLLRGGVFAGQ